MLGVYEMNKIDLLKDVVIWAYERSAERYTVVRQSLSLGPMTVTSQPEGDHQVGNCASSDRRKERRS